jgi:hypothetical protein
MRPAQAEVRSTISGRSRSPSQRQGATQAARLRSRTRQTIPARANSLIRATLARRCDRAAACALTLAQTLPHTPSHRPIRRSCKGIARFSPVSPTMVRPGPLPRAVIGPGVKVFNLRDPATAQAAKPNSKHTIVLIQPDANKNTRTYLEFETSSAAVTGEWRRGGAPGRLQCAPSTCVHAPRPPPGTLALALPLTPCCSGCRCAPGVLDVFEKKLRQLNPNLVTITYEFSDFAAYVDAIVSAARPPACLPACLPALAACLPAGAGRACLAASACRRRASGPSFQQPLTPVPAAPCARSPTSAPLCELQAPRPRPAPPCPAPPLPCPAAGTAAPAGARLSRAAWGRPAALAP